MPWTTDMDLQRIDTTQQLRELDSGTLIVDNHRDIYQLFDTAEGRIGRVIGGDDWYELVCIGLPAWVILPAGWNPPGKEGQYIPSGLTPVLCCVPADQIESVVGVARHPKMHFGRAVSAEQKVYILHSQECRDHRDNLRDDLRECGFSIALERGIDMESWAGHEDVAVALGVLEGLLIPLKGTEVPNG